MWRAILQREPVMTVSIRDNTLCGAMRARRLVEFRYATDGKTRVVGPHLMGTNDDGDGYLLAWLVSGASQSQARVRWRTYKLMDLSGLAELQETFQGARPTHDLPSGGFWASRS